MLRYSFDVASDRLLSSTGVCKLLQISLSTLRRWQKTTSPRSRRDISSTVCLYQKFSALACLRHSSLAVKTAQTEVNRARRH